MKDIVLTQFEERCYVNLRELSVYIFLTLLQCLTILFLFTKFTKTRD